MPRNDSLDGVRGVAILWVIAYHYLTCAGVHPWIAATPGLQALLGVGWVGVMLFFALSGYLITGNLVHTKGRPGYALAFLAKRAGRILPAYVLLLAIFPLAASLWPAERHAVVFGHEIPTYTHWLFIQNAWMAQSGYLGNEWLRVTWSLAVEVQYYLFCLLLVWIVPARRLATALFAVAVAALMLRIWLWSSVSVTQSALVVLTPCRMDSFALGGLVALAERRAWTPMRQTLVAAVGVAGLAIFVAFARGEFGGFTRAMVPFYYTFLAIACAAFVTLAAAEPRPLRFLRWRWLVNIGQTSYFLYLFHMPVALVAYQLLRHAAPNASTHVGIALAALAFLTCWTIANLSFRVYESPILNWTRSRFAHSTLPAPRLAEAVTASPL